MTLININDFMILVDFEMFSGNTSINVSNATLTIKYNLPEAYWTPWEAR